MALSERAASIAALCRVDQLRHLASRREAERGQSPDTTAFGELRQLGQQLHAEGGVSLMAATYDAVVDRYGYRGVFGVNGAWTGIEGWAA